MKNHTEIPEEAILRGPVELADSEIAFDPLEEQFYPPATFVEEGDD
jgi:hypothetical protein